MIQQLPWQPHPSREGIKTEKDAGDRERERERQCCKAEYEMWRISGSLWTENYCGNSLTKEMFQNRGCRSITGKNK